MNFICLWYLWGHNVLSEIWPIKSLDIHIHIARNAAPTQGVNWYRSRSCVFLKHIFAARTPLICVNTGYSKCHLCTSWLPHSWPVHSTRTWHTEDEKRVPPGSINDVYPSGNISCHILPLFHNTEFSCRSWFNVQSSRTSFVQTNVHDNNMIMVNLLVNKIR